MTVTFFNTHSVTLVRESCLLVSYGKYGMETEIFLHLWQNNLSFARWRQESLRNCDMTPWMAIDAIILYFCKELDS